MFALFNPSNINLEMREEKGKVVTWIYIFGTKNDDVIYILWDTVISEVLKVEIKVTDAKINIYRTNLLKGFTIIILEAFCCSTIPYLVTATDIPSNTVFVAENLLHYEKNTCKYYRYKKPRKFNQTISHHLFSRRQIDPSHYLFSAHQIDPSQETFADPYFRLLGNSLPLLISVRI